MIEIRDLTIEFTHKEVVNKAVNKVSLFIKRGESLGVVGESGSGKSLTALSVMQLLPPQAVQSTGEIIFDSDMISGFQEKQMQKIRGNRISMIFQEPMTSLNPVMKCGKQVAEVLKLHSKLNKEESKKYTTDLFRKVKLPRPEIIFTSYPHEISGGQKQRVMIAMAIANKPELLIADEPTTALDVTVQNEIISLLNDLKKEYGMSLMFISHDLGIVRKVCDKVVVMYKGEIVETGNVTDIFNNPKHPYTKGLIACRPSSQSKDTPLPEIDDYINPERLKFSLVGADKRVVGNTKILRVENLNKSYSVKKNILGKSIKDFLAVDDVGFNVVEGETLGLVGESGCGKTTLGRTILRLIEPDSGKVFFDEKNIVDFNKNELRHKRKDFNIVFQDPYSSLNPRLNIGSAIVEPMNVHNILSSKQERVERALFLLQRVGLQKEHFYRYPHEFSGGQRQRIVIARTLALNPKFIICDEAVSALDVSVQAKVLNLLNELKNEFGFTYIFISHDLNVVRYMSDRIMVMKDGKIVEMGNAEQIYTNPKNEYTRKLIAAIN